MGTEGQAAQSRSAILQTPPNESLLDAIVREGRLGQSREEQSKAKDWVTKLAQEVLKGEILVSADTDRILGERVAQIDKLISAQLNAVIHVEEFQALEASWRGLQYLVFNTDTSPMLKIKVLNVNKKDVLADFTKQNDWEVSATFKKIYGEGLDTLGGEPFGCLVGDYEITRYPEDIQFLTNISNVAAAAHAPFLTSVSPKLFEQTWEDFTPLADPRDIANIFTSDAYVQWRDFRKSDDARYVGLCMPHVLMRLPYGKETSTVEEFDYEEGVDGRDHSQYLWGNAAYALATRVTDAFSRHEWCAAIRGVEGGGLVEGLPAHTFKTDDGDYTVKCPTEIAIGDRRENELSKLGFIAAQHYKGTTNAVFMSTRSANQPKKYLDADANANADLSSQLQYIFATSRFAHFLKVMLRDKIGAFMSREQCQKFLTDWIQHYVLLDDFASQDAKSKFPLREAQIEVTEDPAKPGVYKAIARLRPHFQLDAIEISLRLVARVPKK